MAKKKRYNYIRKKIARGSFPAIGADVASFLLLVLAVVISVRMQGNGPMVLGAIGVTSVVAACFGAYLALTALRDEDRSFILAKAAGIAAAVLLVLWVMIIVIGLRGA